MNENVSQTASLANSNVNEINPKKQFNRKNYKEAKVDLNEILNIYPKHIVELVLIVKNNSEIRRLTSIGIINYLLQKNEIKGVSRYVSFKWNKFSVKCDNITKEYAYTESFFINCLVASFTSFASASQKIINTFCRKEMGATIDNVADKQEVKDIVDSTDVYTSRIKTVDPKSPTDSPIIHEDETKVDIEKLKESYNDLLKCHNLLPNTIKE